MKTDKELLDIAARQRMTAQYCETQALVCRTRLYANTSSASLWYGVAEEYERMARLIQERDAGRVLEAHAPAAYVELAAALSEASEAIARAAALLVKLGEQK